MATYQGAKGLEQIAAIVEQMPKKLRSANRRAMARTAKRAKVIASRRIRQNLALKKAYVDKKLTLRRVSDEEYQINAARRGLLLNRYSTRQVQRTRRGRRRSAGYRVRIAAAGQSVHFRHLFPLRLMAGRELGQNIGLFTRLGKERYPIKVMHGPSVSQAFEVLMQDVSQQVPGVWEQFIAKELIKL